MCLPLRVIIGATNSEYRAIFVFALPLGHAPKASFLLASDYLLKRSAVYKELSHHIQPDANTRDNLNQLPPSLHQSHRCLVDRGFAKRYLHL